MSKRLYQSVSLAAILLLALLLIITPAVAAPQPKAGAIDAALPQSTFTFDTASGPVASAIQIEAKSSNWFKFKYHYNNDPIRDNSDEVAQPTQALIQLKSATLGCLSFEVWTQARLQNPQHNEQDQDNKNDKVTPVGRGTPLFKGTVTQDRVKQEVVDAQTLTWAGSAAASDTYYIVVKNKTDAACSYLLSVSGPDVSF